MSVSAPDTEALLPPGSNSMEGMSMQQLPPQPTSYAHGYQPLAANQRSVNTAMVVTQPNTGDPYTTTYELRQPSNYLVLAFIALCLCTSCWPAIVFAIVGMIYSVQVDSQWTNKDYQGAQRASLYAKRWSIAALAVGGTYAGIIAGFILLIIIIGAASA